MAEHSSNVSLALDPLFMARSLFRRRRFEECVKICSVILQKNPYDQVPPYLPSFLNILSPHYKPTHDPCMHYVLPLTGHVTGGLVSEGACTD